MWIAFTIAAITGLLALRVQIVKRRASERVTNGEDVPAAVLNQYNTMFGVYFTIAVLALLFVAGNAEWAIMEANQEV